MLIVWIAWSSFPFKLASGMADGRVDSQSGYLLLLLFFLNLGRFEAFQCSEFLWHGDPTQILSAFGGVPSLVRVIRICFFFEDSLSFSSLNAFNS